MAWKQLLTHITGSVDQALLLRNEYLDQGKGNVVLMPVPAYVITCGNPIRYRERNRKPWQSRPMLSTERASIG